MPVQDRTARVNGEDPGLVLAERIERKVAPAAAVLGVIFVLVVIGEGLAAAGSPLRRVFLATGWALWAFFVGEFVLRLAVAGSKATFLKRYWWQVIFLALPFLRILQFVRVARIARAGRIAGSALRGARSAGQGLRSRIGWIAAVHVIVVLAGSQLLFELGPFPTYGDSLYRVALVSVAAEPIGSDEGWVRAIDVALSTYAVVVFAALAATLGSFLFERRAEREAAVLV